MNRRISATLNMQKHKTYLLVLRRFSDNESDDDVDDDNEYDDESDEEDFVSQPQPRTLKPRALYNRRAIQIFPARYSQLILQMVSRDLSQRVREQ